MMNLYDVEHNDPWPTLENRVPGHSASLNSPRQ